MKHTILYTILILLLTSSCIFFIHTHTQKTEMSFKPDLETEQELQKQIAGIKEKQDELIKIYDFIISNKTERIESK